MVTITIDGIEYEAREGQTVLEVAKGNNIPIPSLCHHEALKPWGACRMCVVETNNGKIMASCTLPVENGLNINTGTGVISGTPTSPATTSVPISATNSTGTGNATLVITIQNVTAAAVFSLSWH